MVPDNEVVSVSKAIELLGVKRSKLSYVIATNRIPQRFAREQFRDGRQHYYLLRDLRMALESLRPYNR